MTPEADADLLARAAALEGELFRRLQARHRLKRYANPDPEIVRVWGRIKDELGEIQRLLSRTSSPPAAGVLALRNLLAEAERDPVWTLDFARELSYSARVTTPLFADDVYLRGVFGLTEVQERFRDVFGKSRLEAVETLLEADSPTPGQIAEIATELRLMRVSHSATRRNRHARLALRRREVWRMVLILVPLVCSTGAALAFANETTGWHVLVAALAGALGSVLSGFLKLRDQLSKLRELRSFDAALVAQPLVGATAGLFAYALVRVGILHLPPPDSQPAMPSFVIYGFVMGFSEPFLLGVVGRVTRGSGKDDAG